MQGVDPVIQTGQQVLDLLDLDQGLRLPDDAAHIAAAVDLAAVGAVVHIAAGAARNAAHVVTEMQVADRTAVGAVLDKAGVAARNAADIARDPGGVGGDAFDEIEDGAGVDLVQTQGGIDALRVDVGAALAQGQRARVAAADAADGAQARDRAGGGAGRDEAAALVFAYDAAHLAFAADRAGEDAGRERAAVAAHEAADHAVVPARGDGAAQAQSADARVRAGLQKEAAGGLSVRQAQIVDRVAAAVEAAVEDGNGLEVRPGKAQIVVEHDLQPVGPGVERAALRQREQVLSGGDMEHAVLFRALFGPGGESRRGEGCEQQQGEQGAQQAFELIHHETPPLPSPQSAPARVPPTAARARAEQPTPFAARARHGRRADAGPRPRRWCRGTRR